MPHQFRDGPAGLERFVRIVLLLLTMCPPSLAQTDVRPYRAPNHIVMALRHLLASDSWAGMLYTEGTERYAVVSWGSSCAVSASGYLVTANHLVKDGERYIVGGWDDTKKLVVAQVVRRDEKADLAVIKVDPPNQVAWIIGEFVETGQIREGMEAFIWGYLAVPGGFMQFLRRGVISNNSPLDPEGRVVYIETTASFGSSGSPAFLADGRPIGIVTSAVTLPGGLPLPAGVAGVIPGEKVNKILREAGVASPVQASSVQ